MITKLITLITIQRSLTNYPRKIIAMNMGIQWVYFKKEEIGNSPVILKEVFSVLLTIIHDNHQQRLLQGLVQQIFSNYIYYCLYFLSSIFLIV